MVVVYAHLSAILSGRLSEPPKLLDRSAARLAMSVLQRRLACSTYALLRSFERRIETLSHLIRERSLLESISSHIGAKGAIKDRGPTLPGGEDDAETGTR